MPALPIDIDQIVITASRVPEAEAQTPASVTVIDGNEIERLGEPLVTNLLRLTPSAAVTTIGPAGSLTEVRIRGSEANHTLLFVDGIKINDPASGDAPRFELLNADLASRIEVVRGPQSALWGSDSIGGVIAINGLDDATGLEASAEGGSFGFARAAASAAIAIGNASLSGAVGWQRATGIDSFGAPRGDKDGYNNLSGRLRGTVEISPTLRLGAAGLLLTGMSQFDGYDVNPPFEHTDTLDNSRNRLAAGRIWSEFGNSTSPWSGNLSASLLGSSNRNFLGDTFLNRTTGDRRTLNAQLERIFSTGAVKNELILAAEAEHETFHADDTVYGGFTDQDQTRDHNSITAEWRGSTATVTGDLAVRRDMFNRFKNATSVRASLLADVGAGFSLTSAYSQGISEPTFFDLYGFFPGNFVGNSALKPENSHGFEASARYRKGPFGASLTTYRQRLTDEIVDVADPTTFLQTAINSDGESRRFGIEAEASWQVADRLRLSANYAYLHATQPDSVTGRQVSELRRPKHSGAIAVDGVIGRWSYGASINYAGRQFDTADNFPFGVVSLRSYWLADARISYALGRGLQLNVRGSNLFDAHYENSAGYHTEGLGLFAGIRLASR
ncbi:MAG TPA: TonB-dependent receptor [Sphingomicrobium sp.]|jgi:vitamin B12 transporter|nr:TonB-dependent receptor [Sphingomicrobium sp.]